jgi:hypothetical protein
MMGKDRSAIRVKCRDIGGDNSCACYVRIQKVIPVACIFLYALVDEYDACYLLFICRRCDLVRSFTTVKESLC